MRRRVAKTVRVEAAGPASIRRHGLNQEPPQMQRMTTTAIALPTDSMTGTTGGSRGVARWEEGKGPTS